MNELDLNPQYDVTNEESKWLQKLGKIDTYGDLDKLVKDINTLVNYTDSIVYLRCAMQHM
jgi:hypothetical protein